jgi:hypothetical protein
MLQRTKLFSLAVILFVAVVASAFIHPGNASAAQITARSLTLQAGADPILNGGSRASAVVNHFFQFNTAHLQPEPVIHLQALALPRRPLVLKVVPLASLWLIQPTERLILPVRLAVLLAVP